jgi:hypothetical protein
MTLDEVAAAHDVSVSTAQRRINRATKRIAALVRRDPTLARFAHGEAQRPSRLPARHPSQPPSRPPSEEPS